MIIDDLSNYVQPITFQQYSNMNYLWGINLYNMASIIQQDQKIIIQLGKQKNKMNPEISPWMAIADHQRYNDIKRHRQQQQLKNNIRINYQKQLMEQMNEKRQAKLRQKQKQKQLQKNMINSSIENQQKAIYLEKMKQMAANQKKNRLDYQNQYLKAARKQRQDYMEEQAKRIQNQMHRQAQQKLRKQSLESQLKKKMILQTLKQSMDNKQQRQRQEKQHEKEFENYKFQENEMLNQRQQNYREEYLRKLKQRAMTIDYGSHNAFASNHYKTLVQRKKQEWESEQEYLNRGRQIDIYQKQYKKLKLGVENDYREELRKQIIDKQHKNRINSKLEVQKDQDNINRYQQYSRSVDMQKKANEDKNKKQLLEFLRQQAQYKKNVAHKQPYFMRDKELLLNYDLLQNSKGIIPGETYDLDYSRKKQLQTVAKSIANSPASRPDKNYLAEIGKSVLY